MKTALPRSGAAGAYVLLLCLVFAEGTAVGDEHRFNTNTVVLLPDGGGVGAFSEHRVAGVSGRITQVTVSIDVRGGWSGDLYAYLNFGAAHTVLLNRPGKTLLQSEGYGDRGFRVVFDDAASNGDIHRYRSAPGGLLQLGSDGVLGGTWAPDGRRTDPDMVLDSDPRVATLSSLTGLDPNGTWTLFVADMAVGGLHELHSWGLTIRTDTGERTAAIGGNSREWSVLCPTR